MIGIQVSFSDGPFSGAMLVSGRVHPVRILANLTIVSWTCMLFGGAFGNPNLRQLDAGKGQKFTNEDTTKKMDGFVTGAVTFVENMAISGISWYFSLNVIKSQGCKLFFLGNITLRDCKIPFGIL